MKLTNKYDEICGCAYVNIFTITKNTDIIGLSHFDPKNKEHLFVLHVAMGVSGVVHKKVAVGTNRIAIWKINKNIKNKESRIKKLKFNAWDTVDVPMLLEFMREYATNLCGEDFNFGMIYDEFYARKD